MRPIMEALPRLDPDKGWALARIIGIVDSVPVRIGDAMAVAQSGEVIGSFSAGCLDAMVVRDAAELLVSGGETTRSYAFNDADPFDPTPACSGAVEVLIEPLTHSLKRELERVRDAVACGQEAVHETPLGNPEQVFVQHFRPRPKMIIVGATSFALPLSSIARLLGYHVTICDPRPTFAKPHRFPDADQVLVGWGEDVIRRASLDERSAVCLLAHDRRSDVATLAAALSTPARYIGALGGRATQSDRRRRLLEAGIEPASLRRVSAPIGLHLGAVDPEEVAVAIAAEIVQLRRGGTGIRLSKMTGPLHDHETVMETDMQRATIAKRIKI